MVGGNSWSGCLPLQNSDRHRILSGKTTSLIGIGHHRQRLQLGLLSFECVVLIGVVEVKCGQTGPKFHIGKCVLLDERCLIQFVIDRSHVVGGPAKVFDEQGNRPFLVDQRD